MGGELPLVVVVDDEASICRALVRLLRSIDVRAEAYCSARDFMRELPARRPDCVILDLQMPHMTGMQLQEHLQTLEHPSPVIIITAFDEPGVRERCLALGAIDYLSKPVEGERLLQTVQALLSRSSR